MSLSLSYDSNNSPFDSIRHYDEQGNEFWLARELMVIMGYQSWQRFETPILQAIENIELTGDVASKHFNSKAKKSKGRTGNDYEMTRYGCYMVALACDGRKVEVALAKKYFAVKTREAEVVIPQQNLELELAKLENERLKLENENLKLKSNFMERRNAIQQLHGVQMLALLDGDVKIVEKVEKITETVICKNGRNVSFEGKSTAKLGKELGFKTGKDLELWLSQNDADDLICQGMRAIQTPYIPTENVIKVKKLFAQKRNQGVRQTILGE